MTIAFLLKKQKIIRHFDIFFSKIADI